MSGQLAVWCSCAWFTGLTLTLCVCYWSFCHPPTPLCTEARPPSRALRFPSLTSTSTCTHIHIHMSGLMCIHGCKLSQTCVKIVCTHPHTICENCDMCMCMCVHVSENGGLGFKVVWQRTHHKVWHGRGEARASNGAGGGGWRRRATRHGEPVRRLRHAAHRAEHGHLLERHRQDSTKKGKVYCPLRSPPSSRRRRSPT